MNFHRYQVFPRNEDRSIYRKFKIIVFIFPSGKINCIILRTGTFLKVRSGNFRAINVNCGTIISQKTDKKFFIYLRILQFKPMTKISCHILIVFIITKTNQCSLIIISVSEFSGSTSPRTIIIIITNPITALITAIIQIQPDRTLRY